MWSDSAFLIFFMAIIALPLIYEYAYKPLRAKNIEGNYYHLGGASQEFLNHTILKLEFQL